MLENKVYPFVEDLRQLELRRSEKCIFLANLLMRANVSMINYQSWLKGDLKPNQAAVRRLRIALSQLEDAMGYKNDNPKTLSGARR